MRTKAEVLQHFDRYAVGGRWSSLYEADGDAVENYSFLARRRRVEELLSPLVRPGLGVLDMGCGTGVMAPFILKSGADYCGVDLSAEMVAEADKTSRKLAARGQRVEIATGDVERIPHPDACFDVVIALGLFEYLNDSGTAADELLRVTKAGGSILVSVPTALCADAIASRVFSPLVTNAARIVRATMGDRGGADGFYHRKFRVGQLDRLFTQRGCKKSGQAYYNAEVLCYPIRRALPGLSLRAKTWAEPRSGGWLRPFATAYIGCYVRNSD